jgi:hypothetical protein
MDIFLRILHLEEKHLRDNRVSHAIINAGSNKDDAIFEKAGIDIKGPLATTIRFDDSGDILIVLRSGISGFRGWDHELFFFGYRLCLGYIRVLDEKVNGVTEEHILTNVTKLSRFLQLFHVPFDGFLRLFGHHGDAL